jgi:hypothetical protein
MEVGKKGEEKGETETLKECWTEHRITLIAYELQYVHTIKRTEAEEEEGQKKNRKRDMEYEGGFLFPGREGDKDVNVVEQIRECKYNHLRELFFTEAQQSEDMLELREFVKIMLELKHHCILREFMEIYDFIIREIKDVKFDSIRLHKERDQLVNQISDNIASMIGRKAHDFKLFSTYLKNEQKETVKLFRVTTYCFIADKHNFNINEFYAEAFTFDQEERKPKKKQKVDNSNDS